MVPIRAHDPYAESTFRQFEGTTNVFRPDGPDSMQHHSRRDTVLEARSMEKRAPNRRDSPRLNKIDRDRLRQLKAGFAKFFDVPTEPLPVDEDLLEDCTASAFQSWFSGRTMKSVFNSVAKWEVDEDPLFIRLFVKAQWVKKVEAAGASQKDAQIIAEAPIGNTFSDAPIAELVKRRLADWRRPNVLMFMEMDPSELLVWYERNWRTNLANTANDYTGWDMGCDRVFLEFDCWLFKQAGAPSGFIKSYRHRRCNSRTFRGAYPIMQPSGDRFTLLANTYRNAALTAASLDVTPDTAACFLGDDSVVNGSWKKARGFHPAHWPMIPKRTVAPEQDFCGWNFGRPQLRMSSRSLYHRLRGAAQRGDSRPSFWRSMREQYDIVDDNQDWCSRSSRIFASMVRRHPELRASIPDAF